MSVQLLPIHDIARTSLAEAVARFSTDADRIDFLGAEPQALASRCEFEKLCRRWRHEEQEDPDRPANRVPQSTRVLVDGTRIVGPA